MKKTTFLILSNKIMKFLLGMLGFTSTWFYSCAYGTPENLEIIPTESFIEGTIKSKETKKPIPNIQVKTNGNKTVSNEQGYYFVSFKTPVSGKPFPVEFSDIDSFENSYIHDKDTTVTFYENGTNSKVLDVFLEPIK